MSFSKQLIDIQSTNHFYDKTVFTLFVNSFYLSNHTFISQTVTNTTKPIRSSLLYEYNNSFSHNKNFLCYLLCRQIGMDEESKFSICFSPFLSVLSCVWERVFPLIICFVLWRKTFCTMKIFLVFFFLRHDISHTYTHTYRVYWILELHNYFMKLLCVQEELCSKRMDLWLPCTQHSLRNNKAGSKGCVC